MRETDKQRLRDYLGHMLEAIDRINRYILDLSLAEFLHSQQVQDAVIRNIEILGEAARNVERRHADFAAQHSEIPWDDIYNMRNRVSHGYFSVDLEIVWKTIQNDLPGLQAQLKKLIHAS